jgi:lipid-binding SYLF domain-containing protein
MTLWVKPDWKSVRITCAGILLMLVALPFQCAVAATAEEINAGVNATLERFNKEASGGEAILNAAKGILVFPNVIKAGIGIGGEYGEGALRVGGQSVEYYTTAAASIGFQLGAQSKAVIIAFMQDDALKNFRDSSGWKVGVDGSIALIEVGAGGSFDSINYETPIVGFVLTNAGLMFNATLEGSKFTKVVR